jgi:hypothetical protein
LEELKAPAVPNAAPRQSQAPSASHAGLTLPDTPAGKTLGSFLEAFNTGDREKLLRFHREHDGDAGNVDEDIAFFQKTGGLKLHSIRRSEKLEIEVLTRSLTDGRWLNLSMEVQASPPHGILDIRVQPGTAPPGVSDRQ